MYGFVDDRASDVVWLLTDYRTIKIDEPQRGIIEGSSSRRHSNPSDVSRHTVKPPRIESAYEVQGFASLGHEVTAIHADVCTEYRKTKNC